MRKKHLGEHEHYIVRHIRVHTKLARQNKFDQSQQDNGKNVDKSFFINVQGPWKGERTADDLLRALGCCAREFGRCARNGVSCEILSLCYWIYYCRVILVNYVQQRQIYLPNIT